MLRAGQLVDDNTSGVGLTRSIYTMANGIARELETARERVTEADVKIARLSKKVGAPFAQMGDMVEKSRELLQLEDELRNDGKQSAMPVVQQTPDGDITLDDQAPPRSSLPQRREDDRLRRAGDPLPEPLFARAEDEQAGTVAQDDKERVSDTEFNVVIERVKAAFAGRAGAALTVGIEPVRGMDDLPPALQEAARHQQLALGKGVFFEDVVYVVQDAHGTAEEVETTIFHELYGHAATASLFGGEWLAKQNALLNAIGGGAGLYHLAAANKIDLHAYADGLAADSSLSDAQRSAIMMDELLAHMAEKKTVLRQKINEFIGTARCGPGCARTVLPSWPSMAPSTWCACWRAPARV